MESVSFFVVRLAQEGDNEQLLRLTRECPVLGPICFYQERAPRFFTFNEIQGDSYRVYVVERGREIIGSVSCVLRWVYLNGLETPIWYVGDLKITPKMRGKGVLREFITQASKQLWERDPETELGFSLIVKTNPASRVLTATRPYLPHFMPLGTIRNYAVHLLFPKRERSCYEITHATGKDCEAITDLMQRVYVQKQFAPVIEPVDFWKKAEQTPGLGLRHFYVARKQGRLLGVAAVWDQQSFKKIKILSFSPRVGLSRIFYNLLTRILGSPPIPPPGSFLPYFYITHVAVDGDDPEVLRALLTRIHNEHLHSPYLFYTVGLPVGDPLENSMRGFYYHTFDALAFAIIPKTSHWQSFDFQHLPLFVDTALT